MKLWDANSLFWYTFDWKPGGSYAKMLERLENSSKGVDLLSHHVPSTMLYGFIGEAIVGRLHVRHELNEALIRRGGNIGYAVAPAFRGNKFATQMMAQGIAFCRDELRLKKILVTCADSNTPSWKIIENFGGRLENIFLDDEDQSLIRRYWIEL